MKLINFIKVIITFLCLSVITPTFAQQTFDLKVDYAVNFDRNIQLKNLYMTGADTVKYKEFWGAWKYEGKTYTNFRDLFDFVAAWNDGVWKGDDRVNGKINYTNGCQSRSIIIAPHGLYDINYSLMVAYGGYYGQGTSPYYGGQGSTQLQLNRSVWKGDSEQHVMKSITWGSNALIGGYVESAYIQGFRITGDVGEFNDPSYHSSGIALWDMGETAEIHYVYVEKFNTDGIELVRGTPGTLIDCSSFLNGRYGYSTIGGALNSYRFIACSGDDNGVARYGALPGFGRISGGLFTIEGDKMESYGTPNVFNTTGKGSIFFDGEGYITLVITGLSLQNHSIVTDALIRISNPVNIVTVSLRGIRGHDYKNILQFNGDRYAPPAITPIDYDGLSFEFNSAGGAWTPFGTPIKTTSTCTSRLGYLQKDVNGNPIGSFNYTSCTPALKWTQTTTPLCTSYTYSAWSTCVGGVQTRTVLSSSPTGCSGGTQPILTQTCSNPCTDYTYSAWSNCVNGTQTRTVLTSNPSGCSGGVAPILTQSCTVQTTPTTALDVNKVVVLYNISETGSQARATAYATAWGIPSANVKGVTMGTAGNTTSDTQLATARTIIANSGAEWCVAVWDNPSIYRTFTSITSALTFGRVTAYESLSGALPTSAVYNYQGSTPKTTKGIVPTFLLHSKVKTNISLAATGSQPKGNVYMLAANDQSGQPRGRSRLTQMQTLDPTSGFQFSNNLAGCVSTCAANMIQTKPDMLAYFNGMNVIYGVETNTILPGSYGDYVTSFGGYLLGPMDTPPQTQITYMLDNGFVGTSGTVTEPYQSGSGGSAGWLAEQFVNIQLFSDAYYTKGLSLGQAVWSSVKCPGRLLILGDPLCTPKAIPTEIYVPPIIPPGPGGLKWGSTFDGTGCTLITTAGSNISQTSTWACGTQSGGKLTTDGNTSYPWTGGAISKMVLKGVIFPSLGNYSRINSTTMLLPDGKIQVKYSDTNWVTLATVVAGQKYDLTLTYNPTTTPTTLIGGELGTGSTQIMTIESIEIY